MKKQRTQFIILTIMLAVVIAAYFGVDKYVAYVEEKQAAEDLLGITYITDLDVNAIEAIGFTYGGEDNFFVKENGIWIYEEDPTLEIEQSKINAMAETLSHVAVENKIEQVTDLEQYGLTEPSRSVSFIVDGIEHVWLVGNMNDLTSMYYLFDEADSSVVYTVTSSFLSPFNYGIGGLTVEEETTETEVVSEETTTETEVAE